MTAVSPNGDLNGGHRVLRRLTNPGEIDGARDNHGRSHHKNDEQHQGDVDIRHNINFAKGAATSTQPKASA